MIPRYLTCICMCVCLCLCIHICACVCVCVCVCACVCCVGGCMGVDVCMCVHACVCQSNVSTQLHSLQFTVKSPQYIQCCPVPPQPQPPHLMTNPSTFQPDGVAIFRNHPFWYDVDFDTLIQVDPCLNAVKLPVDPEDKCLTLTPLRLQY